MEYTESKKRRTQTEKRKLKIEKGDVKIAPCALGDKTTTEEERDLITVKADSFLDVFWLTEKQ